MGHQVFEAVLTPLRLRWSYTRRCPWALGGACASRWQIGSRTVARFRSKDSEKVSAGRKLSPPLHEISSLLPFICSKVPHKDPVLLPDIPLRRPMLCGLHSTSGVRSQSCPMDAKVPNNYGPWACCT